MKARVELERIKARLESGDMLGEEPLFVLRARDPLAAKLVRIWAEMAKLLGSPETKVTDAFLIAQQMDRWHITRTVPGRPETETRRQPH